MANNPERRSNEIIIRDVARYVWASKRPEIIPNMVPFPLSDVTELNQVLKTLIKGIQDISDLSPWETLYTCYI